MDGGILVISSPDGPMAQTREHILLSKQALYDEQVDETNKGGCTVQIKYMHSLKGMKETWVADIISVVGKIEAKEEVRVSHT